MPEFAPVIDVATLNGSNGFRLDGDAAFDYSGSSLSSGDINGDGFADLLIGAPFSNAGGSDRGLAWVVFGAASAPASQGLAARVAAGTAYRFQGEAAYDQAGYSVSDAGDVNGDGFPDFIIGARYADPDAAGGNRGASYLVFGGSAKLEAADAADAVNDNQIALANLTPATGYRFDGGANGDQSGRSVSGAGDINGDGFTDLLIGAPFADPYLGGEEGASYIVFGGANLADLDDDDGIVDGRIDLVQISAGQGLRLTGVTTFPQDRSGSSVAVVGDVNGDGFDDVLIGAPYADPNAPNNSSGNNNEGAAWLVFGRANSQFTAASASLASITNGILAVRFDGVSPSDFAGRAVSGVGDVNGDGLADIAIGAPFTDQKPSSSGSAYVVFGRSFFSASSDLSALDGSNGFRIDGIRADDRAAASVSSAGDVNGDGFTDILVGANGFDRLGAYDAGAAYVVFGKASGFDAVIDLGALDGDNGFAILGAAPADSLGRALAAGDVNGDGFSDIIVSAYFADNNGLNYSGSTYVIYGKRAESAVTRVGTDIDNTINGGKGDDSVSGLSGNDTLKGWEGDDLIEAGDGNDSVDGGTGDDTLFGNSGNDTLTGGNGNDVVRGGSGRDVFVIGAGEDEIFGGGDKDLLDFLGFGSTPVVIDLATGSYANPNGEDVTSFRSVEDVRSGSGADQLSGNGVINVLAGGAGNDRLDGRAGNDLLFGQAGKDTLIGGTGSDRFVFQLVTDSTVAAPDEINDFTVNPAATAAFIDRIDLSSIDARAGVAGNDAFTFIGSAAFTAEGQIRAIASGADTLIEINTTGTSGAEMAILLKTFTAANLAAVDFVL